MIRKFLKFMEYKTPSGKWNWNEIQFDITFITIIAIGVYVGVVYG